jgi:hypothetical protein
MQSLRPELRLAFLGGALLVSGCTAAAVQFSGSREPKVAEPAQIASGAHATEGQRRLGRLNAECSPVPPGELPANARFSDLDCSAALLRAALREGAADAGGSFLTEPECRSEERGSGAQRYVSWIGCQAEAWGPADPAHFVPPETRERGVNVGSGGPAAPGAPAFGAVQQAWRVVVDFWPVSAALHPVTHTPDAIAELASPSSGQVSLGDLGARCDGACSSESMRGALRAAAARMGGSSLVGVRCIVADGAPSCVASVSAPEREDAQLAEQH